MSTLTLYLGAMSVSLISRKYLLSAHHGQHFINEWGLDCKENQPGFCSLVSFHLIVKGVWVCLCEHVCVCLCEHVCTCEHVQMCASTLVWGGPVDIGYLPSSSSTFYIDTGSLAVSGLSSWGQNSLFSPPGCSARVLPTEPLPSPGFDLILKADKQL